jgi:hypothetical protein
MLQQKIYVTTKYGRTDKHIKSIVRNCVNYHYEFCITVKKF